VPHDAIYDHLKALPDGHVLELPFYINPPDNPETDYAYVANRMFHHKPVLNYMRDPRVQCQAIRFARDVNHPRTETAALLRELGVRYLVVHTSGDQRYDLAAYTHDPELAQIARNGPVALIEVKNSGVWSTDRFLAHYDSCVFEGGLMPTAVDSYAIFDPARQTTDRVATFSSIPNGNFLTFGPYVNLEPGRYEVAFNVRASVEKTDVRGLVMGLEVFSGSLGMIAEGEVTREQLADGNPNIIYHRALDIRTRTPSWRCSTRFGYRLFRASFKARSTPVAELLRSSYRNTTTRFPRCSGAVFCSFVYNPFFAICTSSRSSGRSCAVSARARGALARSLWPVLAWITP